ncbi:MAG: efflux RND transporter periplasmic adaptor subunit [Planctomycetia bacterium]|nr:efflux RND transporter periplasmic adaptor subunit [Planctomycetia bacterium]
MRITKVIVWVIALAAVAGVAVGGYATRDRWVPYVFPTKPEESAEGEEPHGHTHGKHDDRVRLTPQAQANLGLEVSQLQPREYWRTMLIPGMVVDRPGESDQAVPSKVAGVVTDIWAKPGRTVRAGDPLFTIQLVSEFVQSTQRELAKSATDLGFALVERDRVASLVAAGTTAGAEVTKAQNVVDRLTTQVNGYRRQLQLFGFTLAQVDAAEKGEVITELVIRVPGRPVALSGVAGGLGLVSSDPLLEVKGLKVERGHQVQAGQTLCILADHQKLFVEGQAFKSEAAALDLAAENKVPIRAEFADETPGVWPTQEPLVIEHLLNEVDPTTRTFAFHLPLMNQYRTFLRDGHPHFAWRYRPGQRVRLIVSVEKLVTLAPDGKTEILPFVLSVGAVVREGPEAFVFVQNGDYFVRKPVRVLHEDSTDVVIANDGSITMADFVVKNQAAALNRALKTAAASGEGHGHGHSHDH